VLWSYRMAKARQQQFFKGRLPQQYNENLLVPLEGEDLHAFEQADGNELAEKMRSPHSSSALCVNFFLYWKRHALTDFLKVFGHVVFGRTVPVGSPCSLRFETKHRFGSTPERRIIRGKPGNIDLDVRIGSSHAILAESKFTEVFTTEVREISDVNTERYRRAFSSVFLCDSASLLDGRRETKFRQLAQRLLYTVDSANPVFRAIPARRMLFLYYDHDGFDRDLLKFPELVREEYRDAVVVLSYQDLFARIRAGLDASAHRRYFEYMADRYF